MNLVRVSLVELLEFVVLKAQLVPRMGARGFHCMIHAYEFGVEDFTSKNNDRELRAVRGKDGKRIMSQ